MEHIILDILLVMLFVLNIFLFLKNKKIKKDNKHFLMIDNETGIGNLEHFSYHFENTISDYSRTLYYVCYITVDSSYLRAYHSDVDFCDVLQHTARTISSYVNENDFVARVSENSFALAYQRLNMEDAKKTLEEIIETLNKIVDKGKNTDKYIFSSAIYNLEKDDKNCELLLFNLRKNCSKIFGQEEQIVVCDFHSMNKVKEEFQITESIEKAFENEEFKMYLQFIVDSKSKKIVSAEALARWDNPEKGLLNPFQFFDKLNDAGLTIKFDYYMFEKVCKQLENWKNTEFSDISISCNFTRITLSEEDFVEKIMGIIDKFSFDRNKLFIEITEDAMEKNMENATSNVQKCKDLGFSGALDDLGSGYTSLTNLCDYPIDVVKIDRDILLKADKQNGKDLFCGIVALAHNLNLKVVCEGVETEEQNSFVSESECDLIQGWYYSRALPVKACEEFYKEYLQRLSK